MIELVGPSSARDMPRYRQTFAIAAMHGAMEQQRMGDALEAQAYRQMSDLIEVAKMNYGTEDFSSAFRQLVTDAPQLNDLTWESGVDSYRVLGVQHSSSEFQEVLVAQFITESETGEWGDSYMSMMMGVGNQDIATRRVSMLSEEDDEARQRYRLLFWILDNPDLMKRTVMQTERVSKAARKRGRRPHKSNEVTVVELRDAVKASKADVAAAERTYRSRWIVRGHWTHQAYGPRQSLRRVQWIPSYVKGPTGAPLVVKQKVSKW